MYVNLNKFFVESYIKEVVVEGNVIVFFIVFIFIISGNFIILFLYLIYLKEINYGEKYILVKLLYGVILFLFMVIISKILL